MFDPYLQWLKIPAERRPPTHYELLGLEPNESDAARIHQAAMQRMALVRRYQLGEQADVVLRLLNELSVAFNCLSDPQRRRDYDEQLLTAAPRVAHVDAKTSTLEKAPPPGRGKWLVGGGLAAAMAVAVLIWQGSTRPRAARPAVSQSVIVSGNPASARTQAKLPPMPAAVADARQDMPPRADPDPSIRWFGYATAGPPKVMSEIAPYTNVVFIRDWVDRSNDAIVAAEEAGLPIVLCMMGKEMNKGAKQLEKVLSRRDDSVLAVCWMRPYFFGFKPADVENAARRIKEAHPTVQFWLALADTPMGASEGFPLPRGVDVLVVLEMADHMPSSVAAKGDAVLPGWRQRSNGKPIVWCWSLISKHPKGMVPATEPGTFRACLELARRHKLSGLVFERYGDPKGQDKVPLNRRPELVEEIRQIAGELGLDTAPAEAAP